MNFGGRLADIRRSGRHHWGFTERTGFDERVIVHGGGAVEETHLAVCLIETFQYNLYTRPAMNRQVNGARSSNHDKSHLLHCLQRATVSF